MIGFNFRMTEIEAAIGLEQLKKLSELVAQRAAAADRLTAGIRHLKGFSPLSNPIVPMFITSIRWSIKKARRGSHGTPSWKLCKPRVFPLRAVIRICIYCRSIRSGSLTAKGGSPGRRRSIRARYPMRRASVRWRRCCKTSRFS